eukprot:TRINITY_DN11597_c0_g1_i2.p1 TRINITY_DN11597_c0_g1~~TRINITY_DN11597_c0_g1_i2.p1  ORF type:complete len:394 (-),score=60.26 TRINITY_DN11597_c0_g1_i2:20-1201(-)
MRLRKQLTYAKYLNDASTKIAAQFRGFRTRKKLRRERVQRLVQSIQTIQAGLRAYLVAAKARSAMLLEKQLQLERARSSHSSRLLDLARTSSVVLNRIEANAKTLWAVVLIQQVYRRYRARVRHLRQEALQWKQNLASIKIQAVARGFLTRRQLTREREQAMLDVVRLAESPSRKKVGADDRKKKKPTTKRTLKEREASKKSLRTTNSRYMLANQPHSQGHLDISKILATSSSISSLHSVSESNSSSTTSLASVAHGPRRPHKPSRDDSPSISPSLSPTGSPPLSPSHSQRNLVRKIAIFDSPVSGPMPDPSRSTHATTSNTTNNTTSPPYPFHISPPSPPPPAGLPAFALEPHHRDREPESARSAAPSLLQALSASKPPRVLRAKSMIRAID